VPTGPGAAPNAGSKPPRSPRDKSLRAFDFDANPHVDPAVIHTLAKCDWVKKGLPLCLIGDSSTGKSHLLIALGTEAAMAGHRVRYVLATKLVNELVEAADEKGLAKTIARYGRVDLLCVDELGYMELDKRGAELLFQVLTEREEKASVVDEQVLKQAPHPHRRPRLCRDGASRPASRRHPTISSGVSDANPRHVGQDRQQHHRT
jgi:chromosomal replication initiation ATPase DnaA